MSHTPHGLAEEFPEKALKISALKETDAHFAKLAADYAAINEKVHRAESRLDLLTEEDELDQFRAWKRAQNSSKLEEVFFQLEQSLLNPHERKFSTVMPSQAYRLLAEAIIVLKKEVLK